MGVQAPLAWQPNPDGVQQICGLLTEYQKPGANQSQIFAQLKQCESIPDYCNYLTYIFAEAESFPLEVRQSAGLLLKNNLRNAYLTAPDEFKVYIRGLLLPCLASPNKVLRHTAGTIISVIVGSAGMEAWPDLLKAMTNTLDNVATENSGNEVDGVLDTLLKICEDYPAQVDRSVPEMGGSPASAFMPRLIHQFQSPVSEVKRLALGCVNLMVQSMPPGMDTLMDPYIQGMFNLAHDKAGGVRRLVCAGLVQMLQLCPEKLEPNMKYIIEYMLQSTADGEEEVALESCEFWSAFCEAGIPSIVLAEFLPRLVPVLMKNMMYDEFDDEVLEVEAADDALSKEDSDAIIKPFIHHSHAHREEDAEEDEEEVSQWNLRKCSAAGLDVLSTVFNERLLPVLMPIIKERLFDPDWRARESAVLALGAISDGCAAGLQPHLGEIVNTVLPQLDDSKPLVRSISCWGLSRYSEWLVTAANEGASGQELLDRVLQGFLQRILDKNRRVQEAACSALATLQETAGPALLPRLQSILQCLAMAADQYQRRNLRILYDALSTLAEGMGSSLAQPEYMSLLMPPLLRKWESLADTDKDLLPLMTCLTSIAQAVGHALEEFAPHCYSRCCRMIALQLHASRNGNLDQQEEVIIVCLDLLSGLAEGLGASMDALIAAVPPTADVPHLRVLLYECCKHSLPDVRQSSFALVGDMAKVAAPQISPSGQQLMELAVGALDSAKLSQESVSACNNAAWSLGELAIKVPPKEVEPFALPAVERLVPILAAPHGTMPRSLQENAAITIGRLAWIQPEQLAPHLAHFAAPWFSALRSIRDDVEKEHAFLGVCACLRLNPQGAMGAFTQLCEAVVSWRHIGCEGLQNELSQIMKSYQSTLQAGGHWQQAMGSLSPAVRDKLFHMCNLVT
mmetsp:Transcript_9191/g.26329  ORF Transcript_9191/g.26329 Transcript_9191/m.26329 type:complete len:907 (-) Transcript_9191:548-3268(-)